MGKFANAIGIWDLKIGLVELDLKPVMKDVKSFRNILVNDQNRKEKHLLYDKFGDFMFNMINAQYPSEDAVELREWIEINLNVLFEEAMIAFKWTNRADLDKAKVDSVSELKKSMSSV